MTKEDFYKNFKAKYDKAVNVYVKAFNDALFGTFVEMVLRCPVLTGRLRYGIRLTANEPSDFCPPPAPNNQPNFYPPPEDPVLPGRIEDSYFFVDNVPYADIIEYDGYSRKAPDGFMRVSLASFKQRFQHAYRERKSEK